MSSKVVSRRQATTCVSLQIVAIQGNNTLKSAKNMAAENTEGNCCSASYV